MNGKARTASSLLVGVLLLVLGTPVVFAADEDRKKDDPCFRPPYPHSDKKDHNMSPEAKLLPDPPDKSWFKDDPCYTDPYSAQAQIDIYDNVIIDKSDLTKKRHVNPNPTGVPAVELGIRMYDRGA